MKETKARGIKALLAMLRVSFVLLLAITLVASLGIRAGVARADDAMMELGRHLLKHTEGGVRGDERSVVLNGQRLMFRVLSVDQELSTVLDHYQSWCHGSTGAFASQQSNLIDDMRSSKANETQIDKSWRDLTLRDADDNMGFVACVKHDLLAPSTHTLALKLQNFLHSGNLKELGQFHYAAATRTEEGTRVVLAWTDGDFFPWEIFPEQGDAPGFDMTAMSRPPSCRRIFSASESNRAQQLNVYIDCEGTLDQLADFYRRDFSRRAWSVLADSREQASQLFVVERSDEMRAIALSQNGPGAVSATIVRSP